MDTQFLALQRTMLQQTSHNILANNLFFSKLNLKKKKKFPVRNKFKEFARMSITQPETKARKNVQRMA